MGAKIGGALSILVGIAAIVLGGLRYHAGHTSWKTIVEIVAGLLLILLGTLRIRRTHVDPTAELMK
jgi:type IV secretory pathway VirB2 component (pilin)